MTTCAVCRNLCQFKMVFPAAFRRHLTTLIVSHLPQNNLLFRQLGILVMRFCKLQVRESKDLI